MLGWEIMNEMRKTADWLLLVTAAACVYASDGRCLAHEPAGPKTAPVFDMQDLYQSMRIPKIVVAGDGSVLAFAKSCRLLRRSEDGGKTWSEAAEVGRDASGNAIVDDTTGDVMVVNPRDRRIWRSSDHGKTWKAEKIVVKPNAVGHGSPDGVPASVGASESGITLQHGKHKGRLLMPARVQPPKGNNAQEYWPYNYNTAIYSDDRGKT